MTRAPRLDDLDLFELPSDPVLSPDGTRVVYSVRTVDTATDSHRQRLWLLDVGSGTAAPLTEGTSDVAARWSPNGEVIAFLREVDGVPQLHLLDPRTTEPPVALTSLPLGAGRPLWSPDGTRIAFTATVNRESATAPIVVDGLGYKSDGSALTAGRSQLHLLDLATLDCRALTDTRWSVRQPAWHPDGHSLLVVGAGLPDSDRLATSAVYRVEVGQGVYQPELLALPDGVAIAARWTRSGDGILVVGRENPGVGHTGLIALDSDGTPTGNLSAPLDRNLVLGSPGYPGAMPVEGDGGRVFFCARDRGATQLYSTTPVGRIERLRGSSEEVIAGLSVVGDRAAIVSVTTRSPGHVVVIELSTGAELASSAENVAVMAEVEFLTPVEREFVLGDGRTVHGWVLRHPSAGDPGPLLLDIHGGPHNAWNGVIDQSHHYHQVLAARGWTVLTLNVVGSDGYGEEFFTANIGAWGFGDQPDFLEPIDALVAEGIADPARLAVSGYSYGGYSTCWLTGHTTRFAAAVAGGLVCDTVGVTSSDEGGPDILDELGATPWGDQAMLLAQSPIVSVGLVSTPTLVLHGLEDHRCPVGRAEEWFVALRSRGVPTEMVLYPGASHLFIITGRPSHRVDYGRRLVEWVERFVPSPRV
jgi:dipeptidyl aminopeptidase/acylaminoacyl peptidase